MVEVFKQLRSWSALEWGVSARAGTNQLDPTKLIFPISHLQNEQNVGP